MTNNRDATHRNETSQIIAGFQAARHRMVSDPGMNERISSLADRTDRAVREVQAAARDLDQALAILGTLTEACSAATILAPTAPALGRKRPDGTSTWVLDTRKRFLNLTAVLNQQRCEAGKIIGILEDSLDAALADVVGKVDEFTRARTKRETARKVVRRIAGMPWRAFELASAIADAHAEAAALGASVLSYGGSKTRKSQTFLSGLNELNETLADIRRETVEFAVSSVQGDLAGMNLGGLDVSGADLANVNLSGALLEGVLWSDSTRWPPSKEQWIRARSRPVGRGIYQVTAPDPGPGRGQDWSSESMRA